MIVRVQTGRSFKGAGLYLLHDKREPGEAERLTSERVPWTYSINTLENDPEGVIREMQATCLNQPMLKLMSGNRVDGRPTEKSVMTVSLAWSPDQPQPTQADMIAAGKGYLKEMGWGDLQALLVPHTDGPEHGHAHAHMHILINRVNPETGMTQDDAWRNRRSLLWAREYDAKQGFFLDRREAKYERGEHIGKDMTRAEWEAWQAAGGTRRGGEGQEARLRAGEWDALKSAQQDERKAFFKESANLRADVRDAVRETIKAEFADQWKEYTAYRAHQQQAQQVRDLETRRGMAYLRKHGSIEGVARLQEQRDQQHAILRENLAEIRAPLLEAQAARMKVVAAAALADFNKERAAAYDALKASHRDEKKELHRDQAAGTHRPDLLQRQHDAAGRLADANQPRPKPEQEQDATKGKGQFVHSYRGTPRPAYGVSRNEAVRRAHAFGTSSAPTPQTAVTERTAADRLPIAAQEVTQPGRSADIADFMARRAADRAAAREERLAGKGEQTDAKQRKENQPKTDAQAFKDAARARSRQSEPERAHGEDDGGRDRDR